MIENIKSILKSKMNKNIEITINEGRSKKRKIKGKVEKLYPNIFTVKCDNKVFSFSYSDILIKKINLK